jgi:hypothetical protein
VASVRDSTQGRLDVVPAIFVFQAATDELGDERAPPSRADATIEGIDKVVLQRYV